MKYFIHLVVPSLVLFFSVQFPQVVYGLEGEYYICEDSDGQVIYRDFCARGQKILGKRSTKKKDKPVTIDNGNKTAIDVYVVSNCQLCNTVVGFFTQQKIDVNIKNADEPTIVKELTALYDGQTVPVVKIGDEIIEGYDKKRLEQALKKAGYTVVDEQ